MRKAIILGALSIAIISTPALAQDGEKLFRSKGCSACHQPATKSVGPSLKEIAKAYAGKKSQLIKFLKGKAKPIVDPGKFMLMVPNLEVTKKMSDKELNILADYILSNK